MRKSLILSIVFAIPSVALAHKGPRGHRHHKPKAHKKVTVVAPHVVVHVGSRPWSPGYVPATRQGYVWVSGFYVGPRWTPGHWRPVASKPPRAHVIFVVGHWDGDRYVDGYWRDENNQGHTWSEGYYEDDGTWVEGGWILTAEDGTEVIMMDESTEGSEPEVEEEFDVIIIEDSEPVESE